MAGVLVVLSMTALAKDHNENNDDGVPKHGWHHSHHRSHDDEQYNDPPYSNWNRNDQYNWNHHNYRWYQNGWRIIDNGSNGYQVPPGYYNNRAPANSVGNIIDSLIH